MTAEEMFEKLGYTRKVDSEKLIYAKYLYDKFLCLEITFDLMEKEIEWFDCYENYTISNVLLLAICKQANELGWICEKDEHFEEKAETNYEYFKEWLNQLHEKPTYKLSQFEYDLLRTNNMSHDRKLSSFSTYENLREIGYFNYIDFDLTIDEILDNCEVIKQWRGKRK